MNKVVARFVDGRIVKGSTSDFGPTKATFHIASSGDPAGSKLLSIQLKDLKALFFVKNLHGLASHVERKEFDPSRPLPGRKIKVTFKDKEVLVGVTYSYQSGRPGFFMVPADQESNIEHCFVVSAAAKEIELL